MKYLCYHCHGTKTDLRDDGRCNFCDIDGHISKLQAMVHLQWCVNAYRKPRPTNGEDMRTYVEKPREVKAVQWISGGAVPEGTELNDAGQPVGSTRWEGRVILRERDWAIYDHGELNEALSDTEFNERYELKGE